MAIKARISFTFIEIYGDGTSTWFTIDLSKMPAGVAGQGPEEDWASKVTNLSLVDVTNYSGSGTISGTLSGTKLTVSFSVAPPAPPSFQSFSVDLKADAT